MLGAVGPGSASTTSPSMPTVATRTGRTVTVGDLTAGQPNTGEPVTAGWCRRAHAVGYRSTHAIPLRLPPAGELAAATAFADIATITLPVRRLVGDGRVRPRVDRFPRVTTKSAGDHVERGDRGTGRSLG